MTITTTAPPAVAIEGLTKRYGERVAVDRLSLTIPTGAVAGLIGPNGAGKTTVMAMLLGLVRPSDGSGTVLGRPLDRPAAYLPKVGALIEAPAFHPPLTGAENLLMLVRLGGHRPDQIPAVLDLVGLGDRGDDRYGAYSLGMKQRLGIAAALLGGPELVILDEPTNGVDPAGIRDMRRIIGDIAAQGRTVLVSSHLLGELEQVCDWLVMIDRGGLIHEGLARDLGGADGAGLTLRPELPEDLDRLGALITATGRPWSRTDDTVVVALDGADPHHLAASLNRRAHDGGIVLAEMHTEQADLEARYLTLVQGATS